MKENKIIKSLKDRNDKLKALYEITTIREKSYETRCERLRQKLKKINKKAQLIVDLGYDYDGFNNIQDLKKLIDGFVILADEIVEETYKGGYID